MINALNPIGLEDRGAFKDAFARGKQKGYVHFFPFLYFYSLSKRWDLLFSEDSGSLCVFFRKKNQKDPARERLSLLFPPVPMNQTALKNAITLINDYNKDNSARIWRIDEHDAHEIAGMSELELTVNLKEEEYFYDPKLYKEMAGAKFSKMRNDFNHLRRVYALEILPYDVKYADQCFVLLEKWELSQGAKYDADDAVNDRIYTRNCLKMADKFETPDLFGKVILIDNEVKSFGFAGEMYNQLSSCFIVKSDYSIPGLNNFMWRQLMLLMESSELVNGSSDMGHPGLKFAKKMLRPVEMAKIFTARQVMTGTTRVKGGRGVNLKTVIRNGVTQFQHKNSESHIIQDHDILNEEPSDPILSPPPLGSFQYYFNNTSKADSQILPSNGQINYQDTDFMKIIPLDQLNIKAASSLADTLFSYAKFTPSEDFKASLDPILFKSYQNEFKDTISLKYWVAVDEKNNTVIGTTGLYELKQDQDEAYWVGWFCVSPRYRGKGIGKKLLHFTINQATIQGKKYLRLYTSTNSKEKNAQILYEAHDLKIDEERGRVVGRKNQIFYREKILNIIRPAINKDLKQVAELLHCPELGNANENFFNIDIISEYLADDYFFIAEKNGVIVGTILGEELKGKGLLIRAFFVKEQYREQGIGTQLFKTLERKCKEMNIKWMISYVPVKNMKTTNFFRDESFQKGPLYREHMKNYP